MLLPLIWLQKVVWFVKINRISLWRVFPRHQADVIILRMHSATDYESSDYLFDKHLVENMKSFVPEHDNIYYHSLCKMSKSVRIRVEIRHFDNMASTKKITFFIGNVMCNNYMFEFKNCINGVKHPWRLMTLQLTEGPEVHQALMLSRVNIWKCYAIRLSTHFFLWTNLLVFGTILLHCCWISHLHQLFLLNTLVLPIGNNIQNKTEPNQRAFASRLFFKVNPLWVTSIPPPSQFKAPPDARWDVRNPGPEPTSHHSRTFSSVTAAVAPLRPVAAAFCHPPARGVCPICSNGFTAKQQPCFEKYAVQTISNELSLVQYWLENVQFLTRGRRSNDSTVAKLSNWESWRLHAAPRRRRDSPCRCG